MDRHERQLIAYLAGDLDPQAASAFDEHLIDCEDCWTAVLADRDARTATSLLREAAPADLAERVRFAVQLAAADQQADPDPGQPRPAHGTSRRRGRLAAFGGTLVLAAAVAMGVIQPWRSGPDASATAVAAVARQASLRPGPASTASDRQHLRELTVDGTRLELRYQQVAGIEVLIATSDRPFTEPDGARHVAGTAMAWTAEMSGVSLYCPSSSVLYAAPVPADEMTRLAGELPAA